MKLDPVLLKIACSWSIKAYNDKNKDAIKIEKLFGGKSVESQALEITLQKKKAQQLERDLKDLFYWSGHANLWHDMLKERTKIRNMRIAEAKAKAETRAAMIDIVAIVGTFSVLFVAAMFIINLVIK